MREVEFKALETPHFDLKTFNKVISKIFIFRCNFNPLEENLIAEEGKPLMLRDFHSLSHRLHLHMFNSCFDL